MTSSGVANIFLEKFLFQSICTLRTPFSPNKIGRFFSVLSHSAAQCAILLAYQTLAMGINMIEKPCKLWAADMAELLPVFSNMFKQ
jgi:hypothetical protein